MVGKAASRKTFYSIYVLTLESTEIFEDGERQALANLKMLLPGFRAYCRLYPVLMSRLAN